MCNFLAKNDIWFTHNSVAINIPYSTSNCTLPTLETIISIPVADSVTGIANKAPNEGLHDGDELNSKYLVVPFLHAFGSVATHLIENMIAVFYVLVLDHPHLNLSKDIGMNFNNNFQTLSGGHGFSFSSHSMVKGQPVVTIGGHQGGKISIIMNSDHKSIIPPEYVAVDKNGTQLPEIFTTVGNVFRIMFELLQDIFWMMHERDKEQSKKNVGILHFSLQLYLKCFLTVFGHSKGKPYDYEFVMSMRYYIDEALRLGYTPLRLMAEFGVETMHSELLDLFGGGSNQTTSTSPKNSQRAALEGLCKKRFFHMHSLAKMQKFEPKLNEAKRNRIKDLQFRNVSQGKFLSDMRDIASGSLPTKCETHHTAWDRMTYAFFCDSSSCEIKDQSVADMCTLLTAHKTEDNELSKEVVLEFARSAQTLMHHHVGKEREDMSARENGFCKIHKMLKKNSEGATVQVVNHISESNGDTMGADDAFQLFDDYWNSCNACDGEGYDKEDDDREDEDALQYFNRLYKTNNGELVNSVFDETINTDALCEKEVVVQLMDANNRAMANKEDKCNLNIDKSAFAFGESNNTNSVPAELHKIFNRRNPKKNGELVIGFAFRNSQCVTLRMATEQSSNSESTESLVYTIQMAYVKKISIYGINPIQNLPFGFAQVAISIQLHCGMQSKDCFAAKNKKINAQCEIAPSIKECSFVPPGKIGPVQACEWRFFVRSSKHTGLPLKETVDFLRLMTGELSDQEYPVSFREKVQFQQMVVANVAEYKESFLANVSKCPAPSRPPPFVIKGYDSQEQMEEMERAEESNSTSSSNSDRGTIGIPIVTEAKLTEEIVSTIMMLRPIWVMASENERKILFKTPCYQCGRQVYSSNTGTLLVNTEGSIETRHTLCTGTNTIHLGTSAATSDATAGGDAVLSPAPRI